MKIELIPAHYYTIEQLTDFYNRTRVDYIVPMPMSPERLQEYVDDYDVDLEQSVVAIDGDEVLGLGMLGVRDGISWITRLGVIPSTRRRGSGNALMAGLLQNSEALGIRKTILEVIKNNTPAHNMFRKHGFNEVRDYLIMRRAPRRMERETKGTAEWLERDAALALMDIPERHLSWLNQRESMANADNCQGVMLTLPDGSKGWLVYRHKKFSLAHFVFHALAGDPVSVATEILSHLHHKYPRMDAYAENVDTKEPMCKAMQTLGYFEVFARIEMFRVVD